MDTDAYAARVLKQLRADGFYIVSQAFNMARYHARFGEIEDAFARYAPRYAGDNEFDVRMLGMEHGWYPDMPDAAAELSL